MLIVSRLIVNKSVGAGQLIINPVHVKQFLCDFIGHYRPAGTISADGQGSRTLQPVSHIYTLPHCKPVTVWSHLVWIGFIKTQIA